MASAAGKPVLPSELTPKQQAKNEPPKPGEAETYKGPYFVVTHGSAGVFGDMVFDRKAKIGYLQSGARTPVEPEPVKKDNCTSGWYRVVSGGYVCGNDGTTDAASPAARFTTRQPNLDDILPYTYARNSKNGTPLYKSVPTPEQMLQYEPYLNASKKTSAEDTKENTHAEPANDGSRQPPLPFSAEAIRAAQGRTDNVASPVAGPPDAGADTPWWQREDANDRLNEIKLEHLNADEDDVLAKRMVKGFYVAVDKQFTWNGRPWYKTTKGLVTPADRFWTTQGSDFHGIKLDGEKLRLPMAFTYGWSKERPKYEIDEGKKQLKTAGSLGRFAPVPLTGKEIEIGGKKYLQSSEGYWVRANSVRVTDPGPPPADLAPKERWVDVNLATQTLVLFEGTEPVYATLVSSGKENKQDKDKDHRTPSGEWRIREKHITTTMDGDGTAAGDLPYSIEDVPYVMYFYRAYALHGAFWHQNYGVQMSHGCVNLSPLDAKYVFFFTEPQMPTGWHGVWASDTRPGSRVIVHE